MIFRVASAAHLILFLSPAITLAATSREFPLPTPGASPAGITAGPGGRWFTELEGNKIGRMTRRGAVAEFSIPTANSGPLGITRGPFGTDVWFTEFRGNKIGRISGGGIVTEYAIPTAASGPHGISADLWFTEFEANKIGHLAPDVGLIAEYDIPTPSSGPSGIVTGTNGDHWFTEFRGNKIGKITSNGRVTEFSIPTPNSGPLGIMSGNGGLWFTEFNAGKIGRITEDGVITEFDLPTPNAGPAGISFGPDFATWFTETHTDRIGRITFDGFVTEYAIPTAGSVPLGITHDPEGIWYTESSGNKIGALLKDRLVIVGAGYVPPWDTDFFIANPGSDFVGVSIQDRPQSYSPCLSCPEWGALLSPGGTAKGTARQALLGIQHSGAPGIRTLYVDPHMVLDAPIAAARVVNRVRPSQAADVPVVRYATIEALDPTVLSFPSATRTGSSHTNLILAEVSFEGSLSGVLEVFSSSGELLGAGTFAIEGNARTLFMADVLQTLGVPSLEDGQIRVTKTGGTGLMWGLLATVFDDGRVLVSVGANP